MEGRGRGWGAVRFADISPGKLSEGSSSVAPSRCALLVCGVQSSVWKLHKEARGRERYGEREREKTDNTEARQQPVRGVDASAPPRRTVRLLLPALHHLSLCLCAAAAVSKQHSRCEISRFCGPLSATTSLLGCKAALGF